MGGQTWSIGKVKIKALHKLSRYTYVRPRLHADLKGKGYTTGKHRVTCLMRDNGIVSKNRRKFRATTDSRHSHRWQKINCSGSLIFLVPVNAGYGYNLYPNPGRMVVSGVTLDLFHRKVVGWAMDRRMTRWLVVKAINMAMNNGNSKPGLIHHSDRGVQALLETHGIGCSMSR